MRFCLHDGHVPSLARGLLFGLTECSSVTCASSSPQFESCWYTYRWCYCDESRAPDSSIERVWWQHLFWHEDGTYKYNESYLRPFLFVHLITPYSQILDTPSHLVVHIQLRYYESLHVLKPSVVIQFLFSACKGNFFEELLDLVLVELAVGTHVV